MIRISWITYEQATRLYVQALKKHVRETLRPLEKPAAFTQSGFSKIRLSERKSSSDVYRFLGFRFINSGSQIVVVIFS